MLLAHNTMKTIRTHTGLLYSSTYSRDTRDVFGPEMNSSSAQLSFSFDFLNLLGFSGVLLGRLVCGLPVPPWSDLRTQGPRRRQDYH